MQNWESRVKLLKQARMQKQSRSKGFRVFSCKLDLLCLTPTVHHQSSAALSLVESMLHLQVKPGSTFMPSKGYPSAPLKILPLLKWL
jgi:hypothetical protein